MLNGQIGRVGGRMMKRFAYALLPGLVWLASLACAAGCVWLDARIPHVSFDAPAFAFLAIWGWMTKEAAPEVLGVIRRRGLIWRVNLNASALKPVVSAGSLSNVTTTMR
jgi:hypothetical protein